LGCSATSVIIARETICAPQTFTSEHAEAPARLFDIFFSMFVHCRHRAMRCFSTGGNAILFQVCTIMTIVTINNSYDQIHSRASAQLISLIPKTMCENERMESMSCIAARFHEIIDSRSAEHNQEECYT